MKKSITILLTLLALLMLVVVPTTPVHAATAPSGLTFDHIIVVAMENQNIGNVINATGNPAPFITGLVGNNGVGSLMTNYKAYAENIGASPSGCSAACYQAVTSGISTVADNWCNSSPPCPSTDGASDTNNIANQLNASSLSAAAFCEDNCGRHADHFPWLGYSNTYNSCVSTTSYTTNCNGQSGTAGMHLYNTYDSLCTGSCTTCSSGSCPGTAFSAYQNPGDTAFINYLNGANPANYIWFTPTDNHNMHDNTVQQGDYFIGSLLCGCQSWTHTNTTATIGIFSTTVWTSSRTILFLWWDEFSNPPEIVIGNEIKSGSGSTVGAHQYDEYNGLHTIERNWGISYINSVVSSDSSLTDIFVPATIVRGLGSIISCDYCVTSVTYTLYTVDNGGTATYTTNAPPCGTGCGPRWNPNTGAVTMAMDDKLIVTLMFGSTDTYHCNVGQITSSFSVNNIQSQLSMHVNCATKPGH